MGLKSSNKTDYDLSVAYRIYPGIGKSVPLLGGDKFRLSEICLKSFRESLGKLRVRMWVILDGCPPQYDSMFLRYFDPEHIELIRLNGAGNAATFKMQLQILTTQQSSSMVYFAEDDYYYLPRALERMIGFITESPEAHFVSPYDHPDYYSLGLHKYKTHNTVSHGHHWRRSATTCLTFLTTQKTLSTAASMFLTYAQRNYDNSIWLSLTKYGVINPLIFYKTMTSHPSLWKTVVKTWLLGWRQICFGPKWNLWTPMPTLATHLESDGLAPCYDWNQILSNARVPHKNCKKN